MIKFMLFAVLGLLVIPTIFASYANGQDADCEQVMSKLKEAKSQYKDVMSKHIWHFLLMLRDDSNYAKEHTRRTS